MIRVKADFSIYNGFETIAANTVGAVSGELARKVVCKGGNAVDKDGNPLPLVEQARMLRFEHDHLIGKSGERVDALMAAIAEVEKSRAEKKAAKKEKSDAAA